MVMIKDLNSADYELTIEFLNMYAENAAKNCVYLVSAHVEKLDGCEVALAVMTNPDNLTFNRRYITLFHRGTDRTIEGVMNDIVSTLVIMNEEQGVIRAMED